MGLFSFFANSKPKDSDVVLSILHWQFHSNNETGVIVGVSNEHTIAADRAKIAEYRAWLTTQPSDVVRAYEYWLSHYERGCNEAEKAIRNCARQKFDERWKKTNAKLDAAAEAGRTFPRPP